MPIFYSSNIVSTENIVKFTESVDLLLDATATAGLPAADQQAVEESLYAVNELMALLASVTEGSAF